ncbi:MAG: rsmA [Acidimicrobiaceae bacterium]|nr:rsmA [Acidimicrobiaceae bacterium]
MNEPRRLGRAEVRRLLETNGLAPTKSLGQHFVVDPNTVERIARLAGVGPGDRVVEIGPGLGSLTLALAATGAEVTAVEIDARLVKVLRTVVPESVRIIQADALQAPWSEILDDRGPWTLVANLPYNVATPLVVGLLESVPQITRILVMVQREVAERLAAAPGGKEYGAVSVRVAYFAVARLAGQISAEVFHPRPNVASALVEIVRRDEPAVDPASAGYEEIGALVRAGFAGRRKMLRRALAGLVSEEAFACAGIASTRRAEELDVAAWGKLAGCQRSLASGRSPS